ncbi:MAG: glycosyltransferase family 2 protein [Anaerolineae bacterium]
MIERNDSPGISAVVITKNEETNIQRCLESLKWADETVVVDSGSTDRTLEIAERCGARALTHIMSPFNANQQRNWAMENGNLIGEWVLFMDADEQVTPALAEAICRELGQAQDDVVGYRLAPKFMFMGRWLKHAGGYPAWHDRLVRKGTLSFVGSWPPDHFEQTDKKIGHIYEPYLHFSFNNGIERWIDKHNLYSTNVACDVISSLQSDYHVEGRHEFGERLQLWASRYIILGTLLRLAYFLIVRRAVFDGHAGIVHALMMAMYQLMIGLKVEEFKRRERGSPM